jgi:hypothetical protein
MAQAGWQPAYKCEALSSNPSACKKSNNKKEKKKPNKPRAGDVAQCKMLV